MSLLSDPLDHLSYEEIIDILQEKVPRLHYDFKKHQIELRTEHEDVFATLRLPLHLTINQYLELTDDQAAVIYLSITSGSAAICIMDGEDNIYHTTFGAYMTRKKQGYSQIKYLNKKGKSRAGSRVRLAETITFFENINTTLTDLFEYHAFDRIALDISISLIPHLHGSKVPCPFEKKDQRLYKIPLHLPQSNFTNLDKAIKELAVPRLFYHEEHLEQIEYLNL